MKVDKPTIVAFDNMNHNHTSAAQGGLLTLYTGPTGYTGYTGYTGAGNFTGYTGPIGPTGYTGYTGPGNFTGYTGSTGYTGYTGAGNFTGYTGPTGYTGYTGPGNFTGYTGPMGPTGYTGYTGPSAGSKTSAFVYIIDGGGSAITTGSKGFLQIPAAYTITGWTLVADQAGSTVVDVKKSTYAGFPTTSSICAADLPTLSAVQKNQNLSAGTWTTAVSAGDVLEFVVNSAATVTKLSLTIVATKT